MKQVINATISQSKEITAMQSEMGRISFMLKELKNHLMSNINPLQPHQNYQATREATTSTSMTIMSPAACTLPRCKKQQTGDDESIQHRSRV
jgi:hypothetical protein